MTPRVLIVDDEESVAWSLRKACERQGYRVTVAPSAEEGLAQVRRQAPDAILLDVRLPGLDGLSALAQLTTLAPNAGVIVMTAHGNLATAVKAVEGGAVDYLAKPFNLEQALDAVKRAITRRTPEVSPVPASSDDGELIGRSAAMQQVFKRIALVAPTDACVMITGESGTGKELVARAIHAHSKRRDKPFLPVHVAAMNPNLVESELFGHARGAFTGAERARPGLLTLGDGGTIFLDELADIPLPVQAKLLRALERQEILPVGSTEAHRVQIRIISATHENLTEAVAAGRFRHDLLFRLNVYPIHLPRLADRLDDIPVLSEHMLRTLAPGSVLPAETLASLAARPWPGNVRELRNALEHAAIEARGGPILPEHLPAPSEASGPNRAEEHLTRWVRDWIRDQIRLAGTAEPAELYDRFLSVAEPALLGEVLEQLAGNRLVAARWLGLARTTVRKLMKKYNLGESDAPDEE